MFPKIGGMTRKTLSVAEEAERSRIGATVRQIREMRGFAAGEFATEIRISHSYLANIEAGRKPLTEALLARIADKLNVRPVVIVREGYFDRDALEPVA